jgi:transcription antitermination protein NusB
MARRTTQRRDAVFALYQSDLTGRGLDDLLTRTSSEYTRALAHATEDHSEELDEHIGRHAEGWTVERIQPLERAILRTALMEMLHPEVIPADTPIPPEGAISEAVELAKTFAGAQSPGFVNGILAAVLREIGETPGDR